jgi:6-phosphogluconate dehydrogenase
MQLGMIGVGRMGGNMTLRLLAAGHECVAFALKSDKVDPLRAGGATITTTLADFIAKLRAPRAVWLMIPPWTA